MNSETDNGANKYGLSKKSNVAIAAITGITVVCNASTNNVLICVGAILVIAMYHLWRQSQIDEAKRDTHGE